MMRELIVDLEKTMEQFWIKQDKTTWVHTFGSGSWGLGMDMDA